MFKKSEKLFRNNKINYYLYNIVLIFYIWQLLLTRVPSTGLQDLSNSIYPYLFVFGILLISVKEIFYTKWQLMDWFYLMIIGMLSFLILKSGQVQYTLVFFLIFSARDLDVRNLLKVALLAQLIGFIGIIGLFEFKYLRNPATSTIQNAVAYGFKYHTYLPHMFFFDVMVLIYLEKKEFSIIKAAILFIINVFLFKKSAQTMNPFILTTIGLLSVVVLSRVSFLKKILESKIMMLVTLLFPIVFFKMLQLYSSGSSLGYQLNSIFQNRIMLSVGAIYNYGVHLGANNNIIMYAYNHVNVIGATYNYIDSALVQYTLFFGVIFIGLFYFLLLRTENVGIKNKDWKLVLIIFLMSIHMLIDEQMIWIDLNPTLLLLSLAFTRQKNKKILINDGIEEK